MSVRACDRIGCDQIMCDISVIGCYYCCYKCFAELEHLINHLSSPEQVRPCISDFMNGDLKKTNPPNEEVNTEFRNLVEYMKD